MIEEIVELSPELQFQTFAPAGSREHEILDECQILKLSSGPSEDIASQAAIERAVNRKLAGKGRSRFQAGAVRPAYRVERQNEKRIWCSRVGNNGSAAQCPGKQAHNPGPGVISQVAVGDPAVSQIEWLARLKRDDAADLPTGEQSSPDGS